MSDRPCNLVTYRQLLRKYAGRDIETRVGESMANGWPPSVEVYVDGRLCVAYASLPTDETCAAFGGSCVC